MENNLSTEEPKSVDPNIVSKIQSGQVVTTVIPRNRLPSYLSAGSATGFKVEKIAEEGEKFPHRTGQSDNREMQTKDGQSYYGEPQPEISEGRVQRKDYIAVSIEKPEGSGRSKDHAPFWDKLKTLEQERVQPSS